MSTNSLTPDMLRPQARRIVPILLLTDQSSFGELAGEQLRQMAVPELGKAMLYGSADDAAECAGRCFRAGFDQEIAPLQLMENVPGWCLWFLGDESTQAASFVRQVTALNQSRPGCFHHVLLLRISAPDRAGAWVSRAATDLCTPFLLCCEGAISRTDADLARAAAAYAYSSWWTYCRCGDASLVKALALPPGERIYTLGTAASELDMPYHAGRWGTALVTELVRKMQAPSKPVEPPRLKTIHDLMGKVLPQWYLATDQNVEANIVEVVMGQDKACLCYTHHQNRISDTEASDPQRLRHLLQAAREKSAFLNCITLPNTRRYVQTKAGMLHGEIWEPISQYLQLPSRPNSFLRQLQEQVDHVEEYAQAMGNARVAGGARPTSFAQDHLRAWRRISSIPNLPGALLRLALIAMGCLGLLLTPAWWGGAPSSELARFVAVGAVALMGVCFVGVFAHYYYAGLMAGRRLEEMDGNLEVRHLSEVAAVALEPIRNEGAQLQQRIDELRQQTASLEAEIGKAQAAAQVPEHLTRGRGRWLTDAAVDAQLQPHLAELAHTTYASAVAELNAQRDPSGMLVINGARWQRILWQHAARLSEKAVRSLSFDQCAAAMAPRADERQALIHSLTAEAVRPAWTGRTLISATLLCFADPTQWQAHVGRQDQIEFRPLWLKDMVMVGVIPLQEVR